MGKLEGEGGGGAAAQQGGQLTGARLGSGAAAPEGRVGVNLNPTKFCQILALSKFGNILDLQIHWIHFYKCIDIQGCC